MVAAVELAGQHDRQRPAVGPLLGAEPADPVSPDAEGPGHLPPVEDLGGLGGRREPSIQGLGRQDARPAAPRGRTRRTRTAPIHGDRAADDDRAPGRRRRASWRPPAGSPAGSDRSRAARPATGRTSSASDRRRSSGAARRRSRPTSPGSPGGRDCGDRQPTAPGRGTPPGTNRRPMATSTRTRSRRRSPDGAWPVWCEDRRPT